MNEINNKRPLQIAIDGPVGSGKGTLAVALAKRLNAVHVYTGGMYRALALACKRLGVNLNDEKEVFNVLENSDIDLKIDAGSPLTKVILNGENVSEEIFFPEISNITPIVASYKSVREEMVRRQRKIIGEKRSIVEGRDIATHVIPNADIKISLTADVDTRARRRFNQLIDKHVNITLDEVKKDVLERDDRDSKRKDFPLEISKDSFLIDTSNDTVEDTVNKVFDELNRRGLI